MSADARVRNARLGVWILIATEVMLFAGLVSAYLVLKGSAAAWPPPDLPVLPLRQTAANTAVLLASAVTVFVALRALQGGRQALFRRSLGATACLGLGFLAGQGLEWCRLMAYGLRLSSGVYGGIFYAIVGLHALHVAGALLWLGGVWMWRGRWHPGDSVAVELCATYWIFVAVLWPLLFALVYLPW